MIIFVFLALGGGVPETENEGLEQRTSAGINQADVFSVPRTEIINEPSDLIIAQGNTIYASAPLFMPETQILGAYFDTGRRDIILYTVQSGDTLDGISSHFGISRNTIIWANELRNLVIRPEQELAILPVTGVFHIVVSGDTIDTIASKYRADATDVIEFNKLSGPNDIRIGDILIIPDGEIRAPLVAAAPRALSPLSSWLVPPASGIITQLTHWDRAVDIANNCGTPVYAAASGIIQLTGYHVIAGNFVRILHPNGVVTFYGHLSRIGVVIGQSVSQGAHIGDIGNTGYTIGPTGCHLHFEVRGAANPFFNYPKGHRF